MDNGTIKKQCELLGWLIDNKLKATKIQKNKLAEHCDISVNTLNNAIKGNNINIQTLLSILQALGMNFIDAGSALQKFNAVGSIDFPEVENAISCEEPEIDVAAAMETVEDTSTEQTAMRMGQPNEAVAEITQGA